MQDDSILCWSIIKRSLLALASYNFSKRNFGLIKQGAPPPPPLIWLQLCMQYNVYVGGMATTLYILLMASNHTNINQRKKKNQKTWLLFKNFVIHEKHTQKLTALLTNIQI